MATSGPNNAGSVAVLAGGNGSWATTANATGGDNGTTAVWSKPAATNQTSPGLELSSFGTFTGVTSGDTINSVTVSINEWVASTTRMAAFQFELWDGNTARIGATQTGTNTTSTANADSAVFTGVTFSQLSTLRVRIFGKGSASNAQSSTGSVDFVSLTVDYTPAATTHSAAASGASTFGGSAAVTVTMAAAATGSATSTGSAAASITSGTTYSAAATGASTSTGSAGARLTMAAAAAGASNSTGSAAAGVLLSAAATGASTSAGSAAATITIPEPTTYQASASGTSTSSGTATPRLTLAAVAVGALASTGSADAGRILAALAAGTGTSSGSAAATIAGVDVGVGVHPRRVSTTSPGRRVSMTRSFRTVTTSTGRRVGSSERGQR